MFGMMIDIGPKFYVTISTLVHELKVKVMDLGFYVKEFKRYLIVVFKFFRQFFGEAFDGFNSCLALW